MVTETDTTPAPSDTSAPSARFARKRVMVSVWCLPEEKAGLLELKKLGFSDRRLAQLSDRKAKDVSELRGKFGVHPVFKRVDSCAAEFEATTRYLYSYYEGDGLLPAVV